MQESYTDVPATWQPHNTAASFFSQTAWGVDQEPTHLEFGKLSCIKRPAVRNASKLRPKCVKNARNTFPKDPVILKMLRS